MDRMQEVMMICGVNIHILILLPLQPLISTTAMLLSMATAATIVMVGKIAAPAATSVICKHVQHAITALIQI